LQAAVEPLVKAGWRGGTLTFTGGAFDPFRYVMPGPPDNESHVAYFSAPRQPAGVVLIEQANATFGWHDGKPWLHCHATWIEPDGARRGGHILTDATIIAEPVTVHAWGSSEVDIATSLDPETNFTLFQPGGSSHPNADAVIARVRPNEDIITAIETIAQRHDMPNATIRGSLGSLVGARFLDGTTVPDNATEVLVRNGHVRNGRAALDLLVVDGQGHVHEGWLERGENPVCITFDLLMTRDGGEARAVSRVV
jgi:predicted DNA-binding protein with PD1-like motif